VDAVAHGLRVDETESLRSARFGKEPLAGSDDHRVDLEVDCVDEIVLDQRLRELRTAVHDDIAFVALLELRRLLDHVAAQHGRVAGLLSSVVRCTVFNQMVDQLSATFAALGDPTRRAILERLAAGEATVNELAEPFPITVQAVSKHLRVLERAGLIERSRAAQLRPSRLRGQALGDAAQWLERYRSFWTNSFDDLDRRLRD
jgi:DNA-binding transcriptional ArsR family regulator